MKPAVAGPAGFRGFSIEAECDVQQANFAFAADVARCEASSREP